MLLATSSVFGCASGNGYLSTQEWDPFGRILKNLNVPFTPRYLGRFACPSDTAHFDAPHPDPVANAVAEALGAQVTLLLKHSYRMYATTFTWVAAAGFLSVFFCVDFTVSADARGGYSIALLPVDSALFVVQVSRFFTFFCCPI